MNIETNSTKRMELNRRQYLTGLGATAISLGLAGCTGERIHMSAEWNYKEYSKVRFPWQSEDDFFKSDDETQYVGVRLEVTNEMNESANLMRFKGFPEVTLFADGLVLTWVFMTERDFSSLESVGAGETVEATLLYPTPPEASSYTLGTWEDSEHTYDISRDENLEIELIDKSDS